MTNFILQGYQKPLHHKKNKFTRDELQLELYRQTYELMKNYKEVYINSALRKIRLSNLFDYIKTERNRNKTKKHECSKCAKPDVKIKTDIDLKREQWLEARQIGNKFSKMNKFNKTEFRERCCSRKDISVHKAKKIKKAKEFGNMWSLLNVVKIRLPEKNSRGLSHNEELLKKRRCTFEYGSYYSLRNKLNLKDTQGEFDSEYQNLLEKCVEFEKDHLNVCGFLEEQLYAKYRSQLNTKYRNSKTQTQQNTNILVEKVAVGVQVNMDEKHPPLKPHHHNSDDPVTNVCIKSRKIENTSRLSSNNNRTTNPQNYDSASKSDDISDKLFSFSEAVAIGRSFEDAVLHITNNCEPEHTEFNKMKLIISDLFLAFGMNFIQFAVGRDTIIEDIEMDALRDIATDQSDNVLMPCTVELKLDEGTTYS